MPIKKIPANSDIQIITAGAWLSIIDASARFKIESPQIGVIDGAIGRQIPLNDVSQVDFVNNSGDEISVEYEVANRQIYGASRGVVSVDNEIIVKRIVEPQEQAIAISGIDDGQVRQLNSNVINALAVVSIGPNSKQKIIDARAETNRKVTLQNISANTCELWIGDINVTANKGSYFRGSLAAPSAEVIENEGAIYVFNNTNDTAKVAVREEYRP
jgi:hypothetical protein